MASFTDAAGDFFQDGIDETIKARNAKQEMDRLGHVNDALAALLAGLYELSGGLRATYIKIEQLDSTIRQFEHRGAGLLGR